MPSVKNPKQGDVYLLASEIVKKLNIPKRVIYWMRNFDKIRWTIKKAPWCGEICNLIHFNLDDVRENIKKDGC